MKTPFPSKEHLEWADCEIGVIIHLDMPVFEPEYEFRKQWGRSPSPSKFNPAKLNTDQWLECAKSAGAKYAILTAKHCSGFCLWPSSACDYNVSSSPWRDGKGDVAGDFIRSCEKFGLKPGFYYSTACNARLNVDNPGTVRSGGEKAQALYNEIVVKQLTELWTRYGKLFEIWFDGGCLPESRGGVNIAKLLERHQPQAIVFQGPETAKSVRWAGNEFGHAPYPCWGSCDFISDSDGVHKRDDLCGSPYGKLWCPAEADTPNRSREKAFQSGWFWKAGEDSLTRPAEELFECYCDSVGRNCNLLVGMAINDQGLFSEVDAREFKKFGLLVDKAFGKPDVVASGEGVSLEVELTSPFTLSHAVLTEDIAEGEKVLSYKLEARQGEEWVELASGSCIGHKRIERFKPLQCSAFRVRCEKTRGTPAFKAVKLYGLK